MLVPLAGRAIVAWFERVGTRRNDDCGSSAVIDDGVVGWLSVIGAVGRELSDRSVDMVEQRLHSRGIASVLAGQRLGDDVAAIGIQRQMQLSPTTAGSGTMLLFQPLAHAVDLQAGAVDNNMYRSVQSDPWRSCRLLGDCHVRARRLRVV